MRKTILFLSLLISLSNCAQKENSVIKESKAFQYKMNMEYADLKTSPLTKKDFKKFSSLDFFNINENLNFIADFKRTPNEKPFEMVTTTSRLAEYVKYGVASFKIDNKIFKLNIYQNQSLKSDPEYVDYLFLPFTDKTNGKESYSGGRYVDLSIKDIENQTIKINFNKSYNPYCAYNHKYSCPIPPKENHLAIAINAGVKKFH